MRIFYESRLAKVSLNEEARKTLDEGVDEVLETSRAENLAMISESVAYIAERGRELIYDAEHFFDGFEADRDYALDTLRAARDAGASTLVLCDTNGGTLTGRMSEIVGDVRATLAADAGAKEIVWGIHTHNDAELAVANSIAAVQAGVPPDYFSATGQLWGNPIYAWDRMAADGVQWWIRRMRARSPRMIFSIHFKATGILSSIQ